MHFQVITRKDELTVRIQNVFKLDVQLHVKLVYVNKEQSLIKPTIGLFVGRIQNMDHTCGPGPWTTPVDHPSFCKVTKKIFR